MTISAELVQTYAKFVNDLLNDVEWQPNPEQIVWHYTTGPGLISIIESGTLYATQVSCLNDASEIRYAAGLLRKALLTLVLESPSDPDAQTFVEKYAESLRDDDSMPNNAPLPYFVSCFSKSEDDLSQWRSYGGGENGYSIGFRSKDLFGVPNSIVAQVNYSSQKHTEFATKAAEATLRFYKEGALLGIENWNDEFMTAWDTQLTQLAPIFKDPGFELEREVRLVHQLQEAEKIDLRVMQRTTMMSRHLPIRFPSAAPVHRPRLPIYRVMVGPGRHKAISAISVDTLLRTHGYSGNLVFKSERPYQQM